MHTTTSPQSHFPEAPLGFFTHQTTHQHTPEDDIQGTAANAQRSSSLDTLETSVSGSNKTLADESPCDPGPQLNLGFRHTCWLSRRHRTFQLLRQVGGSPNVLERFSNCGSIAWVLKADDTTGRYRIACNRCRSRWCVPCATEKARLIARNVKAFTEGKTVRFLTLTLKHSNQPLTEQMDRLALAFKDLRRREKYRKLMPGGVFFFEVKLTKDGTRWHPHLHALVEGQFIDQRMLSTDWLEATGDSYIVDIRKVPGNGAVAGYVAKYAGKALEARTLDFPDKFAEAVIAFRSRRLFTTFGTWTNCDLSKRPPDDVGWTAVAPLHTVIANAANGDPWAVLLLRQLKRSTVDVVNLNPTPDTS